MKSFVSTLVFALGTAALAAAQSSAGAFYITAPLEGDTWTAGKTYVMNYMSSKQILTLFLSFVLAVKQSVRIAYATRAKNSIQLINSSLFGSFILEWINGMNQNISINLIEGKDSNSMVSTGDSINANGISGTASWNVSFRV